MAWYSHLFNNFPQFAVIHTVKGFGVVNKAEVDVFLELSCFFYDPKDAGNLVYGSSAFSNPSYRIQILVQSLTSCMTEANYITSQSLICETEVEMSIFCSSED